MNNNILSIIIQLVSGGLGGYFAGRVLPRISLGATGDIIAGIIGGGLGGWLLGLIGIGVGTAGSLDLSSILTNILAGAVGGAALLLIIAALRRLFAR